MSKVFVTSDTHFGHANIIKYCGRPFQTTDHMNVAMVERWNDRVSMKDAVYFLGDFAMGRSVNDAFIMNYLSKLNGLIYIIAGNHDKKCSWSSGIKNLVKASSRHLILPDVHECTIDNKKFIMSHYPMEDWDGKFKGSIHLHGHCHSTPTNIKPSAVQNRFDVGVDMHGGPVEITGDCRYLKDPKGWK